MANDQVSNVLVAHKNNPSGVLRFIPAFLYIFVMYLAGRHFVPDPRAVFVSMGGYNLSWVELLLLAATVVSLFEQLKVSHPGIDNTLEALLMVGMGVVQLIFFILGAANIALFATFKTPEFLILTFVSLLAAVIAILINARTLRRSIGVGDN